MDKIFDMIINADQNIEFSIRVLFMEIYNEKILDLLNSIY